METYVSTTVKSRWTAVIIIILIIAFQVQSNSLSIVQWSPHTPAVIGQSVTLVCVFNSPLKCTWSRSLRNRESQQVRSNGGYSYRGDYMKEPKEEITDCSLTIAAVTTEDFTGWLCTGFSAKHEQVHSPWTYITKQITPSAPVIRYDNVVVSSIELTSSHPPTHMTCSSYNGNPAPSLHWEVDGTVYSGKSKVTITGFDLYTVELRWDGGNQWRMLNTVSEVICRAIYPGFTTTTVSRVQLRRQYAPRAVKIMAGGFNHDIITIGDADRVTLSCISDGHPPPTTYMWELWSENDTQWKSYGHSEQNISVTSKQLGRYRCKARNQLNQHSPTISTNQIIVIKSMPPTSPVIWFNNKIVSSIDLPLSDPPSHMVCKSQRGNPPLQLHWEVNGTRYLGKSVTIYVGSYLYVNELSWDRGGGWHIFDDANQVVCTANYTGVNFTAKVNLTRKSVEETMLVNGSNDQSGSGAVVGVTGGLLVAALIIIVILTVALVKSRQRLRRVEMRSKSPSVASVAQLHRNTDPPATANATTDVVDSDMVTYGNVGCRTNAEPNVYWEAMRIYE